MRSKCRSYAVLFANSYMEELPNLLCARDLFWENSTHGINPHNIGMYEQLPESQEEFLDYIMYTSIFCTERDDHYLHFRPIPISEYFEREEIEAEYYDNGVYRPFTFVPRKEDLELPGLDTGFRGFFKNIPQYLVENACISTTNVLYYLWT